MISLARAKILRPRNGMGRMQNLQSRSAKNLVVGALVAVATMLAACEEQQKQAATPPPPTVNVAEVVTQDVPIVMEFSGTLDAIQRVEIVPRVSGYIMARHFTEGAFINKGDLLYEIDPRPYQATLDQAKAELETTRADLKFWTSEVERYERLVKSGGVSQEKLEATIANRNKYTAQVSENQANIASAALNLGFTKINAPMDGRIQQTRVFEGANVSQQQSVLTEIVQVDPINVIFNVTRNEAFEVQKLQAAGTGYPIDKMTVQLRLPDGTLYPSIGRIDFVSARIDATTDSALVRGVLANHRDEKVGYTFLPGQYVPVLLTAGSIPNALVIPSVALIQTQAGTFVFVVGSDNKVERRKIEIGRVHKDLRVVTKGLEKGEKVVVAGLQKIKNGMTVEVKPAKK
jgi:RND family efflux transporter MFP subunit